MKGIFFSLALGLTVMIGCNGPDKKNKTDLPFYLPDDLEATLWAQTPMFYNPTNMDVDAKGRIWITEAVNYRSFNNKPGKFKHFDQGDRVMILEDTDKDGVADTAKLFVQDTSLVAPVGIAVMGNKVIVSCAPNVIVYTDEDGDDHPDKKEIFLTGFGGMDHDHSLHAMVAGPDGKWYFNAGNAGPHIVTDHAGWTLRAGSIYTGGSPYNKKNEGNLKSDDGKVWVGGVALSINPDGTGLGVKGHNFRNAYELTVDSYGNMWQNDNDDEVAACRTSWLMEGGNAGFFSEDGTRSWSADQRPDQEIFTAHWHQEDPGVMPVGDRSGAGAPTGITINEGDALGEKYRGLILSADAGRNVIFGYLPEMKKSAWIPAQKSNFISSLQQDNALYVWNDTAANKLKEKWFRPSDVTIGTDGAIYVADWYDPVVGGHQMQDSTATGRVYRITPKNKKLVTPKIDLTTLEGQVEAFCNPAINVRSMAFVALQKQGAAAVTAVKGLLDHSNPYVRARAIWLLPQLGAEGKNIVTALLDDKEANTRVLALRSLRVVEKDIYPVAAKLQNDPSAYVRREVAHALATIPFEKAKPVLLELIKQYEGDDKWYLAAVHKALSGHEEELYPEVKQLLAAGKKPTEWSASMADWAWELHPAAAVDDLLQRINDTGLKEADRKAAITALAFIRNKNAAEAMLSLHGNKDPLVAERAAYWLAFRQGNDWYAMLDWSKVKLNSAYEKKLGNMKARLLAVMDENLSLDARKRRLESMAVDSLGGQLLIGLAAENKIPAALLPAMEQSIFKNPDITIRVQAGKYFKQAGKTKHYSIDEIAALKGNADSGKAVFASFCVSCHKVQNTGSDIGPELTNIGKKFDKTSLLDAIIHPSAAILLGYEPWLINTKDGGSFFGFLISENKQTVTIKDITGQKHIIEIDKISTRQKQEKSLMPEPGVAGMTDQQLANVAGYLLGGK